jgi:hypothetical protein
VSARSLVLSEAAREQSWRLLWQRLLQPIPNDPDDDESESDKSDEAELHRREVAGWDDPFHPIHDPVTP